MSPVSKLIAIYGQFFPFTVSLVAVSVRIFMNKGQFWFQTETVCWCSCVSFGLPLPGFVTADGVVASTKVGFESNEHVGKVLPFKNNPVLLLF